METHNNNMQKDTTQKVNVFEGITLRPLPVLTIAAIIIPTIFFILMIFSPGVLSALQRDQVALAAGQWWRLLSPLLVDSDGWWQLVYTSLGFVCLGILAEHLFGWWRWLLIFLSGALAGEIAGYLWQPYGGGTSIALLGLLGGLLVCWPRRNGPITIIAAIYALGVVPALACGAVFATLHSNTLIGIVITTVLCWALVQLFLILLRRHTPARTIAYVIASVDLLGAVVLTVLRDNHGPALLAGACVGALLLWLDPMFNRASREA